MKRSLRLFTLKRPVVFLLWRRALPQHGMLSAVPCRTGWQEGPALRAFQQRIDGVAVKMHWCPGSSASVIKLGSFEKVRATTERCGKVSHIFLKPLSSVIPRSLQVNSVENVRIWFGRLRLIFKPGRCAQKFREALLPGRYVELVRIWNCAADHVLISDFSL